MADQTEIKKVITVDLGNTTTSLKEYKKHIEELRGALLQLDETSEEYNNIAKEIATEQDKLNEVMKVGKGVTEAADGSYNQLAQTMAELKKQWKATGDEVERNQLGEQILDINNQLKDLDASTGNYQRNVGDYANAFEKAFDKCLGGIVSIDGPLGEIAGTTKNLIPVIKSVNATATAGLSGIKKGIASTGIGLLVVAVGELAAHWEDIVKWAQKLLGVTNDDANAIANAADQAERMRDAFKGATDEMSFQSRLRKAQGEDELVIMKDQLKVLETIKNENRAKYLADKTNNEELKKLANESEAAWRKMLQDIQIKEAERETQRRTNEEAELARIEEERKKRAQAYAEAKAEEEEFKKIREQNRETIPQLTAIGTPEEVKKSYEVLKSEVEKQLKDLQTFYENQEFDLSLYEDEITYSEKLDAQFNMDKAYIEMRISLNQELLDAENITEIEKQKLLEDTDKLQQDLLKKEKKYNAEKRKDAKATAEFKKQQTMMETQAAIGAAGNLFGTLKDFYEEDSEEYKGLAIMEAILNGLQAIMGTWAGYADMGIPGTIAAGIQTAMIVATTAATVAKMKSTNKNSSGSGSIPAPQVPQLSATTVNPLLDETADLNRLEESGLTGDSAKEQQNMRVYVVDQDIRDANHKAEVVESNATF